MPALGFALALCFAPVQPAQAADIDALAADVGEAVVAWRRDIHQHPELGNREFRTSALVAQHLEGLGMEVRTGIAHTGVTGLLKGGRPGPRIALRADMDALPVTERTGLPFASTVTTEYAGQTTGVMHACGHDAHVAILMGVAQALAGMRGELPGEVLFVFQPAEEGPPPGEDGGASMMLDEGIFDDVEPEAVYGLHVWASLPVGQLGYRSGPMMASADRWVLDIAGQQTHGSRPWGGVDPIAIAGQVLAGMNAIIARQIDITSSPVVLSPGRIEGGIRFNIIPDTVQMEGTLRTFDMQVREDVIARFARTASAIAEAAGGSATLEVENSAPVTANDAALTTRVLPTLHAAVGEANVVEMPLMTVAEDFSEFANRVPGFFFFVGSTSRGIDPATAPNNHSPEFLLDEESLDVGVRAMLALALAHLVTPGGTASD
ncbi:amidohydrolase [Alcalisalibacterium limoincola]|uniref:Amidohydrolase n=1 Tax=Alkalisalibacterium limincola TaxID=2699169 RepID=A0A5C8KSF4_9GAMM|nr:amidohydrolase [Alkalisalibacterium limincola]